MKYSDLNLKTNTETNIAQVGNLQIEVLQYLPVADKLDLIEIALQNAEENGIYNELKLDVYFNLYIIFMYTNLEFSEEDKADMFKLYDELQSNNIIISVIGAMEEGEYEELLEYLKDIRFSKVDYYQSTASLIRTFVQDMPKNAAAMSNIVDNFDPEKYKEVIDFAKYANGGMPFIPGQK